MSSADLCQTPGCGHGRFAHNGHGMKNICCGSASCPCAAFIPAQPATEPTHDYEFGRHIDYEFGRHIDYEFGRHIDSECRFCNAKGIIEP